MSQTRLKKKYDNPIKEMENEENTFTFYGGTQKLIKHEGSETEFISDDIVEGINKIVKKAAQRPK
jgi:hypothetical protein